MSADDALGFQNLEEELARDDLPIEGDIPGWLTGTLVRTGPAKFDFDDLTVNHWFDGLAMLRAFGFSDGSVSYRNRFLRSEAYHESHEQGRPTRREFATDPCRSIFKRIINVFTKNDLSDNASVNVGKLAGRYVAMTESTLPVEFDPETLETRATHDLSEEIDLEVSIAHPHYVAEEDAVYNHGLKFGFRSRYRLYRTAREYTDLDVVADIPVDAPSYIHSFGLSGRYALLAEFPLLMDPTKLGFGDETFAEHLEWDADRGTRLTVVDRRSGEIKARPRVDSFFAFHHINAFDEGGTLVADLAAYDDASIVDDLYLDRLRENDHGMMPCRVRRFRIDPSTGEVDSHTVADRDLELPRINPSAKRRPYRFVWGTSQEQPEHLSDALTKIDVETGDWTAWSQPGCFPGEPVVVPTPEASTEDDAVVLSVVLDAQRERSFLLVLDAATLEEIGRAYAPHPLPFSFHGSFFSNADLKPPSDA